MDDLDRLILQTLQQDGRTPFTHIAKQAGVSESTIRTRYSSLIAQGVARTISVVDPYALNFEAPAIIQIDVQTGCIDQVAIKLAEIPEVSYLLHTLGKHDLLLELFCRDMEHLTDVLMKKIHSIPGIQSAQILMIAKTYKLSYRWLPVLEGN